MISSSLVKRTIIGAAITGTLAVAGTAAAMPAMAATAYGPSGFSQVAGAPVGVFAPVDQILGSIGAPVVNVNIPCPAPWQQGGVLGARYNACNAAPVFQQNGW